MASGVDGTRAMPAPVAGARADRFERLLCGVTLLLIMVPLSLQVGPLRIGAYEGPLALLLLTGFLRAYRAGTLGRIWHWDLLVTALSIQVLLAALANQPTVSTFGYMTLWLGGLVLAVYAAHTPPSFRLEHFAWIAVVGGSVEALLGLVQGLTGTTVGSVREYFGQTAERTGYFNVGVARPVGTFSHPNMFGIWEYMTLAVVLGLVWQRAAERRGRVSYVLLLAAASIVGGGLLSLSRAAMAIVLALPPLASMMMRGRVELRDARRGLWRRTLVASLVLMAVASLALLKVKGQYGVSLPSFVRALVVRTEQGGAAARYREKMNRIALRVAAANPVWGVGFRKSRGIWATAGRGFSAGWTYRPHDIYVVLLVEGGILALVLFVLVLVTPVVHFWRHRTRADLLTFGLFWACTAALLGGVVYLETLDDVWPFLMFTLGLLVRSVSGSVPRASRSGAV